MYFCRIDLGHPAADSPELWRALGNGYELHRLVWRLFADSRDRRRDFLFRQAGPRLLYAVAARPPLAGQPVPWVSYREYHPRLRAGQRLGFDLRANPIRSRRDPDGHQQRHDVVMEAKLRLREQGVPREQWPPLPVLASQEGLAWLAVRAEAGGFAFAPGEVRVEGYRQHDHHGRGPSQGVRLATLDFQGVLTVKDPEAFGRVLMEGLGHGKGFGCGLMLIRPAGGD